MFANLKKVECPTLGGGYCWAFSVSLISYRAQVKAGLWCLPKAAASDRILYCFTDNAQNHVPVES